jgi:CRP-like cAMP-binding protein
MSEIVQPIKETEKHQVQAIEIAVFKKGQAIISEGQDTPLFFVILSGQVVLSKRGKIITALDEQDTFGLESILLEKPCSYSALALKECRIAKYGPEALDYFIHESPRMIQNVLASVVHQLTQTMLNVMDDPEPLLADEENVRFYQDGEVISEEKAGWTEFYRLVSTQGGLQVTESGKEVTRICKPGEFFGLPGSSTGARISSIGQSVVEQFSTDDLDIIIRDYPEAAGQIMRTLIERLSDKEAERK